MMVFDDFDQIGQLAGNLQNQLQQLPQQVQGVLPNLGGALPGGLGGFLSYLPWIALAWVTYVVIRRSAGPTVALTEVELNPIARVTNGAVIRFDCRRKGIGARALSLFNLDPGVSWIATKEAVRKEFGGLFGRNVTIIPVRQITAIRTEFSIPKGMFVIGVLLAAIGLFNVRSTFGFVQFLVGMGLVAYSFFNRRYVISVESSSSGPVGIALQPALLGGPAFDFDKLQEASRLLEKLVRSSDRGKGRMSRATSDAEPAIPLAPVSIPRPLAVAPRIVEESPEPSRARMPDLEVARPSAPPPGPPRALEPLVPPSGPSVFQPDIAPKPRPSPVKPKKKRSLHLQHNRPAGSPANHDDEKLAADAFDAAVRVFESKRPGEAEAAWWALIRRWPNTAAAGRARRILDNRHKRERERERKRQGG